MNQYAIPWKGYRGLIIVECIISALAPGIYVLAIEDRISWDTPTYANLYLVRRQEKTILIDAGLRKYQEAITKALATVGVTPASVTHVLATHGHHDHVDGAGLFPQAVKVIHPADRSMLSPALASRFMAYTSRAGDSLFAVQGIDDFDVIWVNSHSPGSVVIFDHVSQTMFAGDFFCFFGESLPEGELISYGDSCRQESYQYVAEQAASGAPDFADFMRGLNRLLAYHPAFFCTGHGVVLRDQINEFLQGLWKSGQRKPS